jgi:O-antigen ligase
MFLQDFPARKVAVYSHNDWIQFLAEFGLAGTAAGLVLGIGFVRALARQARAEAGLVPWEVQLLRRGAAAGLLALLAHAVVEFHLRMPAIGFQALALLALVSERGVRWMGAREQDLARG